MIRMINPNFPRSWINPVRPTSHPQSFITNSKYLMEYVQPRANRSATPTVQTSPKMIMDAVHHPSVVHSCDISLSLKHLEASRLRLRIYCAELSTGLLSPHPVMSTMPSDYFLEFSKVAQRHPVIAVQNPAGQTFSVDLGSAYQSIAAFKRFVPYFESATGTVVELPAHEIPAPFIFRVMSTGQLILTDFDPGDSQTEKITTKPIERREIEDAALDLLALMDTDLAPHVPQAATKARILSPVRKRIAEAFELFVNSRTTTLDERADAATVLQFAPYVDPNQHVEKDLGGPLSKEQKLAIMRSYHLLPGTPPPVHYNVLVRLD